MFEECQRIKLVLEKLSINFENFVFNE